MGQKTLDFFAKKRPQPKPVGEKQADPQPEPQQMPKKPRLDTKLAAYTRGNSVDPDYLKNPINRARHDKALRDFGPKPQFKAPKRDYKPLELQFIELKRDYLDTILFVEVGFRYRAWGQDAVTVARHFGFKESNGWLSIDESDETDCLYDRFATFSFPTPRIAFYVQRLVNAGYKVGIVNQQETTAVKKAGTDRSGPFKRQVSAVYTKGTFINEFDVAETKDSASGGTVLGVFEYAPHCFAICGVQASTGEIIYDKFKDSAIATELETRILHLEPCEIVQVGELTGFANKLIKTVVERNNARQEVVAPGAMEDVPDDLEPEVRTVASCLYRYLAAFKLEQVFGLKNSYSSFNISSCMYLNGNTLSSLEIFQNSTDFKVSGSLFWVMDNTVTKFGQRLLRKWILQPLLNREDLEQRVEAVTELLNEYCTHVGALRNNMKHLPDLERSLLQIHYGRITRKQLYDTIHQFHRLCTSYTLPQIQAKKFTSPILKGLFETVPECTDIVQSCLARINPDGAKKGDLLNYFYEDESEEITRYKNEIRDIRHEFDEFIKTINFEVKYVTVLVDEYLIEIKPGDLKKVPSSWQKMGQVKAGQRFRTPETFALIKRLDLAKERLEAASQEAFVQFVQHVKSHYSELRRLIMAIANLDCLMSLSAISSKPGYVKVDYVDNPCIEVKDARHPAIDELITKPYIPNDVKMYPDDSRTMVITGPNMGGKSSYVRTVALIVIMAQVGAFVPASKARLSLMDAVYTRMGAYDNMIAGESTFQVELKETANILKHATQRSLVLLDEIGRGTSTTDGVAIAYSVLDYIVQSVGAFTLFITHYPLITELASMYPNTVTCWCMEFSENEEKVVTFLYKLVKGISHRSYGLNVARIASLPPDLIEEAAKKSQELEAQIAQRREANALIGNTLEALEDGNAVNLLNFINKS